MSISLHPDTTEGRTLAAAPPAGSAAPAAGEPTRTKIRSRLFTKYVALFVAVVAIALLSNGIFEVFFYYREHKASLIRIQHEQAEAAAAKISQFIKEIESQLGWTTQLPWSAGSPEERKVSLENRRFDALRLLRQVPAITELAQVDSTGKERLRVSRLAMDSVDSGLDLSKDPKFTEAVAHKVYYGPVYFRRESEPYMTLSLAGTRKDAGVSIAEVNLKLIWDVVSQIKVGEHGHAYVVGSQGRLIAHPDISLVLRNTDMSKLVQVQAALAEQAAIARQQEEAAAAMQAAQAASGARTSPQAAPPPPPPRSANPATDSLQGALNIQGQEVLTASAPIWPLRWIMFVELPVQEAYASLYAALQRLAIVLLAASTFAVLAGIFLARRMVGPIQALRAGAERIGGGDFAQRISIKTGDELEGLANQFNDMGERLQESYADLENKVEQRTAELKETLEQQTATAEILASISASMTDTKPVFDVIVRNLVRLFGTRFAVLQTLRDDGIVEMAAVDGEPGFEKILDRYPRPLAEDTVGGLAMLSRHPVQFAPVLNNPAAPATTQQFARDFGFNSVNFSPMLLGGRVIGAIGVAKHEAAPFDEKQVALIASFANQAVIAIENTRLLKELRERTDDLSESLEQQTATSEVLETISSSPGELEPVFKKMLENATRVCGANFGTMNLWDGEKFSLVADHNIPSEFAAFRQRTPISATPGTLFAAIAETHQPVQVDDLRESRGYKAGFPHVVGMADIAGARTLLMVPMLKEDDLMGAITIIRQEVRPFTEKQIALVENFTKQAVIAIENTRLLRALRERTEALTQSLDELRTAQDRLIQTEKLASLGQLTAGIAHEIKNPLNFVNNFSALSTELIDELNDVLKSIKIDDKNREEIDELTHMLRGNLEKVVQHGKRADSIVKNMLLHSREGSGEHRPADINAIVEESLNLAYHGARAEKSNFNITLKRDLDPAAGMIDVYPQEITRVFLNLISNGFYAATKRKETAGGSFEPTLSAMTKSLGNRVEIRIRDNGTGIPPEVKEKMFNPFFTTKPAGEGTGLGLSMSHDIVVKQHGGKIDVATEPGSFTEFIITLPRSGAAQANIGGRN